MTHFIQQLMDQHGYLVLGIALTLELLALPLPGEVLMTYTGLLVFQGHLNWMVSILTAGLGTSMGMTISYWIGYKLGKPFFQKHGTKFHLGPENLEKTSLWFERYGNKLLLFAYFIPGVRHLTGYFSGITRLPFRTYMIFAYTGAFLWTSMFISLGKILGPKWELFHHTITKYLIIAGLIAAVVFAGVYVYKKYRDQIYDATLAGLRKGVKIFHTLGRVRFLLLTSFGVFLILFMVMASLIQDLLANEFADFDVVTSYIVHALFDESWAFWMNLFAYLASFQVLFTVAVLALIMILIKGEDRPLEWTFLLFVFVGGELWDEGFRRLFHRIGPSSLINTFPSEQTLITVIFLGFAAYLIVRHVKMAGVQMGASLLVLTVAFLVGISRIYFNIQYPSDVVAGYVFGGVWLSLNVVLLEVLRLMKHNKLNFST
ncbi:VTT domain-containing protein [Paenibacillus ottowii]|uniref:VTT domain-containing protein n=1 Tax=Paenibacillus ottowii TaxID=2315729 RepID=UPI00272FC2D7|nr:VTT domain-containing protein [Paenibacillus ottowii]MDP1511890.1 VTT domain-containing protein [Paenibacillus ottowii]